MTTSTWTRHDLPVLLRLSSALRIERDPDHLFGELQQLDRFFECVPGVSLTRVLDPRTVEARMVVGLGPITIAYDGTARMVTSDRISRMASIDLQGRADVWGSARANMKMTVRPVAGGSSLHTSVWLALTGRTTLLGRDLLHRIADEMYARTGDRIKRRLEDAVLSSG
jgi:carbon monoxide dehydrogenase subunit G